MSREWKPGDVAMVRWRGKRVRAFRTGVPSNLGWEISVPGERQWTSDQAFDAPTDARPLVVIDPEDREQVERLVGALRQMGVGQLLLPAERDDWDTRFRGHVAAALRSLIAPPRPPEPQGLGAVVEDADGLRWLRMPRWTGPDYAPWASADKEQVRYDRAYDDIDAVRVLSEGVTA